jgi:hypothetical protein
LNAALAVIVIVVVVVFTADLVLLCCCCCHTCRFCTGRWLQYPPLEKIPEEPKEVFDSKKVPPGLVSAPRWPACPRLHLLWMSGLWTMIALGVSWNCAPLATCSQHARCFCIFCHHHHHHVCS